MPIQRIVCFKFKPDTTPEAILQHMRDFAGMQDDITQIREYRGGLTRPGDYNRPSDFDTMHYMVFDSMEDIDTYFYHQAHQRFIERNKAVWDNVIVINSMY